MSDNRGRNHMGGMDSILARAAIRYSSVYGR